MKGTVALVVFALAATWAFLFLPAGKPATRIGPKPPASTQTATPSPAPQAASLPQRATPLPPKAAPASADPVAAAAPATQLASASTPAGRGDVRIIGSAQTAATQGAGAQPRSSTQLAQSLDERIEDRRPTGELGEGILSPDYKLLEESYVQEARDGPWATQQELRIRNLLLTADMGERIVLINCQSSVCRVQLEPRGQDPFGELLRVPGLAGALGIDSATPYSLNSAELIVYAKPDPVPEPTGR